MKATERWRPPVELLNTKETCELMQLSRPTVMKLVNEGRLPAYQLGPNSYRFARPDVEAAIAAAQIPMKPAMRRPQAPSQRKGWAAPEGTKPAPAPRRKPGL